MADTDQDQKTEHPTSKRLGEARDRGQLAVSKEISSWVMFLGVLICLAWLIPAMANNMLMGLRVFLEMPHTINIEGRGLQTLMFVTLQKVALATFLVFAVLAAAAILGHMVQTGFYASTQVIQPKIERLNPMNGIQRLFSMSSIVELLKSFVKMVVFGVIVYLTLNPVIRRLPAFGDRDILYMVSFLHSEAIHLILMLMLAFTLVAFADLAYTRYSYIKGLRMTKTEVKDEFKQQEGDPMIKNRLRSIRLEKARKRMMAQVPKADVVITNPTHYAIALQYNSLKMAAPLVLAKGTDRVAERIREVATENAIPLVSNPPLARALYDTVDVDEEIPTQHYRAVAEIISYVYKLKKRKF